MSDALSIIAIVVSMLSFLWSLWIGRRLEQQATARFAFDAIITTPIEGKLQQFEAICEALAECALDHAESDARSKALQQIIRRRFNSWYFSTDAMLQAAPTKKAGGLIALLAVLPDEVLSPINRMSLSTTPSEIDGLSAELAVSGARFVAGMRAQIHETRLAY